MTATAAKAEDAIEFFQASRKKQPKALARIELSL
jgi:hypothetical protein